VAEGERSRIRLGRRGEAVCFGKTGTAGVSGVGATRLARSPLMHKATRRLFLQLTGSVGAAVALAGRSAEAASTTPERGSDMRADALTLFLCGDVMLGRGIDQILPHRGDPVLHEPYVRSAITYVELAEATSGPIPRSVAFDYVWGDALDALRRAAPAARIVNLETSITDSTEFAPKGINYKMHPANVPVLTAADIDCCVLANNHLLDWSQAGLLETLRTLEDAGIRCAGAGRDVDQAAVPAILPTAGDARVLVFAFGATSSGIPRTWAAESGRPGINLLPDLSDRTVAEIAARARAVRRQGDVLVASIHWGGNWGYEVPAEHGAFAHGLIDWAGFDVVHGHSSHHPKAIEIHQGKPILYGCGDFLNDYEGITGEEEFRGDLAVMYLPRLALPGGALVEFALEVFQIRRFRLERAARADTAWLQARLDRESRRFGARIELREENRLAVVW
jgi:poly-gamma-glutamate capsule biosynthesis protein CapA/YwtB (metallophosphatase superfamily)